MKLDYVVHPISELDGYYLEHAIWLQDLDAPALDDVFEKGVICQAFDERDYEIGKLAIDGRGKILIVEVKADQRRQGIATRMLAELQAAGYEVEHDGKNMRDDGADWARSVVSEAPK